MSRPYPEALPGKRGIGWSVQLVSTLSGATSFADRIMSVPGMEQDDALAIRVHETAHAAQSPTVSAGKLATKHGVSWMALQAAEDARIHQYVNQLYRRDVIPDEVGRAYIKGVAQDNTIAFFKQQWNKLKVSNPAGAVAQAVKLLASTRYTNDYERMKDGFDEAFDVANNPDLDRMIYHVMSEIDDLYRCRRGRVIPPFKQAVKVAKLLDSLEPPEQGKGHGMDMKPDALKAPKKPRNTEGAERARWGKAILETPPLVEDHEIRRRMRRVRTTECGTMIGDVSRLLVDEKVFREAHYVQAGTCLIDCSGSMGIGPEEVRKMVLASPAMTVALYSGQGDEGPLRIVAHRGRLAKAEDFDDMPGGNIIDGPALEWLGTQEGPRIWVSDGGVTSINDTPRPANNIHAAMLCVQHRIFRTRHVEDVTGALAALRERKY
jgi:hypothetical protein